jgi:hypothetical protein
VLINLNLFEVPIVSFILNRPNNYKKLLFRVLILSLLQ